MLQRSRAVLEEATKHLSREGLYSRLFSTTNYPFQKQDNPQSPEKASSIYGFSALDIDGNIVNLSKYNGLVTYIVNVASEWGLTKTNYAQMIELQKRYGEQGLRVLAFQCNQFNGQEPGDNKQIKEFAAKKGCNFDMFSKINVNGAGAHPLYIYLKSKQHGILTNDIKWNFSKFLCNRHGVPVKRYSPTDAPLNAENDIKAELSTE